MTTRAEVVSAARALLRTPYVAHGRVPGPEGGTDCLGVLILVARACGLKPATFDVNNYALQPDGSLMRLLDKHCQRVPRQEMQAGDIVVMSWGSEEARHVGIVAPHLLYAGHFSLIHAHPKGKGVVEHRLEFGKFMRFVAAYRFPGVE